MINSTFVAVKKIDIDDDWTCIRFKRSEYIKVLIKNHIYILYLFINL